MTEPDNLRDEFANPPRPTSDSAMSLPDWLMDTPLPEANATPIADEFEADWPDLNDTELPPPEAISEFMPPEPPEPTPISNNVNDAAMMTTASTDQIDFDSYPEALDHSASADSCAREASSALETAADPTPDEALPEPPAPIAHELPPIELSEPMAAVELPNLGPPPMLPAITPPPVGTPRLSTHTASDVWEVATIDVQPTFEDNGRLLAFRATIAPIDLRAFRDCTVTFPLPTGVKQVHASRKPVAKKGRLTWNLGPIEVGSSIPLSVKLPIAFAQPEMFSSPPVFQVRYQIVPAAELVCRVRGAETIAAGEIVSLDVELQNIGIAEATVVLLRATCDTPGVKPIVRTMTSLPAGESIALLLEIPEQRSGLHTWRIQASCENAITPPTLWHVSAIEPAVELAIQHDSMIVLERESELTITVTNPTPVAIRGLNVQLEIPIELAFESGTNAYFDVASSSVLWTYSELPPNETVTLACRVRGFAPGLTSLRVSAQTAQGTQSRASASVFVELPTTTQTSALETLLGTLQTQALEQYEPTQTREHNATGARHVLFTMAGQSFAVPIESTREVVRPPNVTPIPGAPDWLLGVANLRGDVVSVVDLALLLELETEAGSRRSLILTQSTDGQHTVGFLVQQVERILRIKPEDRVPLNELDSSLVSQFMSGLAQQGTTLLACLDFERLLLSAELNIFDATPR